MKGSHSDAGASLSMSEEDVSFLHEKDLVTRIRHFGEISSTFEDERVFATLAKIGDMVRPVEGLATQGRKKDALKTNDRMSISSDR